MTREKPRPTWFKLKAERRALIEEMDGEQVKHVILACMDFLEAREIPQTLTAYEKLAFTAFYSDLDEACKQYAQRIKARRSISVDIDRPRTISTEPDRPRTTATDTEEEPEEEPEVEGEGKREGKDPPTFSPPTLSDVKTYCTEKGLTLNTGKFVAHYQSTGWMAGKNPVTNWKALVDRWAAEDKERDKTAPAAVKNRFDISERADYGDMAELERKLLGGG